MHRSVLLLLMSVLVLSVASALPRSLEESLEGESQQELKAESVETVYGPNYLVNLDSFSVVEHPEQKKLTNLALLSIICPKKDLSVLEDNPSINVKLEREDMYAICAQLKDRRLQRRRRI